MKVVTVLPTGLQPILVHLSKDKDGHFAFNPLGVNFMTEIVKCIFAIGLLMYLVSFPPGFLISLLSLDQPLQQS